MRGFTGVHSIFGFAGGLVGEGSDRPDLPLLQVPAFAKVVSAISRNVSQVPFQIGRWKTGTTRKAIRRHWKTGFGSGYLVSNPSRGASLKAAGQIWEPLLDHPLQKIFDRPSPWLNRFALWDGIVQWLCHEGKAFLHWVDVNSPGDMPSGIEILDPTKFERDPPAATAALPERWLYTGGMGIRKKVEFHEVTYIRYFSIYDPIGGLSPRQASELPMSALWDSWRFNRSIIRNGGFPGGIITSETQLSKDQRDQMKNSFNEAFQGPSKANRVWALWGNVKYQQLQYNHRVMQFLEQIEKAEEDIQGIFKVPDSQVSQYENASYASAEIGERSFWNATILPIIRLIEDGLWQNPISILEGGDLEGRFDLSGIRALQENRAEKITQAGQLFALGWAPNQISDYLGLDLPKHPAGDRGFLPLGIVPIGTSSGSSERPGVDADEEDGARGGKRTRDNDVGDHAVYWRTWNSEVFDPVEKALERKFSRYVRDLRAWSLRRLDDVASEKNRRAPELRASTPSGLTADDVERILFDKYEWGEKMGKLMRPLFADAIEYAGAWRARELGLDEAFALGDNAVQNFIELTDIKLRHAENTTIVEETRQALLDGISEGESVADLAQRLRDVFNRTKGRALMVARTETLKSTEWSKYEVDKQSGVVQSKLWVHSNDEVVRDSHVRFHARGYIGLDESYAPGLLYPGGPDGPPGEIINCRCVNVAGLVGENQEQALSRTLRAHGRIR